MFCIPNPIKRKRKKTKKNSPQTETCKKELKWKSKKSPIKKFKKERKKSIKNLKQFLQKKKTRNPKSFEKEMLDFEVLISWQRENLLDFWNTKMALELGRFDAQTAMEIKFLSNLTKSEYKKNSHSKQIHEVTSESVSVPKKDDSPITEWPEVTVSFRLHGGRSWNEVQELQSFKTISKVLSMFFNLHLKHDPSKNNLKVFYTVDTGNRNMIESKSFDISIISCQSQSSHDLKISARENEFRFPTNNGHIFGAQNYDYEELIKSCSWKTFKRLNSTLRNLQRNKKLVENSPLQQLQTQTNQDSLQNPHDPCHAIGDAKCNSPNNSGLIQ